MSVSLLLFFSLDLNVPCDALWHIDNVLKSCGIQNRFSIRVEKDVAREERERSDDNRERERKREKSADNIEKEREESMYCTQRFIEKF